MKQLKLPFEKPEEEPIDVRESMDWNEIMDIIAEMYRGREDEDEL